MSPPPFLMVDFSTVLSLDRLPPMSFPWTHKLSQHLCLNLHKILYSVGIVENTREYAKQFISFHVLYYQRTQQFHKSALNINCTVTSTKRALQLIDTAAVQRARKLSVCPNGNRLHVQACSLHVHTQMPEGLKAFK